MFSDDGAPACVVGHYFVKELGFDDLYQFETKAPTFILEAHGYEVEPPAQRFLNTIQSQQDQGWEWEQAYDQAVKDVERHMTNEADNEGDWKPSIRKLGNRYYIDIVELETFFDVRAEMRAQELDEWFSKNDLDEPGVIEVGAEIDGIY